MKSAEDAADDAGKGAEQEKEYGQRRGNKVRMRLAGVRL